jgi:MFS family permease
MTIEADKMTIAGEIAAPEKASWRHWYLVAVIVVVVTLNYIDRGTISLIVNPIKEDLGINDVQMSTLLGLSFVVLYSVSSIPAGYLADRVNRKLMMFYSILFWSFMLLISGLAGSYWQLFAGRVGLGLGEAAMPPAAYSLIRDGVPREKHARAYAIYGMGGSWGIGLGALLAGWLVSIGTRGGFSGWPVLEHLKPWQLVLAVPGICGMLLAFLVLTVREPSRQQSALRADRATFGEAFRYLGVYWKIYVPIVAAVTFYLMAGGGLSNWAPAQISRKWGISTAATAHMIGLIQVVLLPVNNWTIGYLMDRFGKKGTRPERYLMVPIIPIFLSIVPVSFYFLVPKVEYTWAMLGLYTLCNCSTLAMTGTVMAAVTPSRLMGKVTALYFLIANLLGFALGPTVFALVAKWFFSGSMIRSIQVSFPIAILICVAFLSYAAHQLYRWRLVNQP